MSYTGCEEERKVFGHHPVIYLRHIDCSSIMTPTKPSVAKDVFAYLLTFVMLYIGVVSFIALFWQIINVQFPDPVSFYYQGSYDAMRNAIASLIVVWPVFLVMSRYLHLDMRTHHEKADLWVRRWLTYLTVFVAAITMIIDLITLINSFLSGELTISFILKTLVVLVVAGGVFAYEFWDLKRSPDSSQKTLNLLSIGSAVLVVLSIVAGFIFVGSPAEARDIRLDTQRLTDLQGIQSQIISYWNTTGAIPASLDQLADPLTGYVLPTDPVTHAAYEYTPKTDLQFNLCASFARSTPEGEATRGAQYYGTPYPLYDVNGNPIFEDWKHEAGRGCFDRTIDPKRHKYPKA